MFVSCCCVLNSDASPPGGPASAAVGSSSAPPFTNANMPITGEFTWEENADTIQVRVPLKGTNRHVVDVFVSDLLVKVNYSPYLLVLDLARPVDDIASKAVFAHGELVLSLSKKAPGLWEQLEVDKTSLSKAQLRARRQKAIDDKTVREQELAKKKKDQRYNDEQLSMKKEWAIVDAEKKHIEDLKEEEKSQAEKEVYRTLAKVQAENEEKERRLRAKAAKKSTKNKKVVFQDPPVASGKAVEPVYESPAAAARARAAEAAAAAALAADSDEEGDVASGGVAESKLSAPPNDGGKQAAAGAGDGAIFTDADAAGAGSGDDDSEEEDIVYVPPPRSTAKVQMNFTERIFPTPLRESKVAQEEDWIAKNKVALDKRRKKLNPDARDISERDPVWLKGKADDFYRAGDFRSAANAYSSAIDADSSVVSCYSNRAACFLALGELPRCVEDCDAALEMLPAPEDVAKLVAAPDPHPDQLRWHRLVQKVLVRRGTALCRMGKYEEALRDYKIASELKPDDEALLGDVQRIERLIKCAGLKKMGDDAYRAKDVATAIKHYTSALEFDPSFVACLSNRAACLLATNQCAGCVADCTAALQLMNCDHDSVGEAAVLAVTPGVAAGKVEGRKAVASGPVPEPGTDRHTAWLLKTMVRRGTALAKLGKLEAARRDYEKAVVLDPTNTDLLRDLARLRARCKENDAGDDESATDKAEPTAVA